MMNDVDGRHHRHAANGGNHHQRKDELETAMSHMQLKQSQQQQQQQHQQQSSPSMHLPLPVRIMQHNNDSGGVKHNNVWRTRQEQHKQAEVHRQAQPPVRYGDGHMPFSSHSSSISPPLPHPFSPVPFSPHDSMQHWPTLSSSIPASSISTSNTSEQSQSMTTSTSSEAHLPSPTIDDQSKHSMLDTSSEQEERQRYLNLKEQYSRPEFGFTGILHHHLRHNLFPSALPISSEVALLEVGRKILENHVQSICPGARLVPFGSLVNNLGLRHSDLDLCLVLADPTTTAAAREAEGQAEAEPNLTPKAILEQIGKIVRKRIPQLYVQYKTRARIPIIKIYARYQNPLYSNPWNHFVSDISVGNTLAIHNTRLLKAFTIVDERYKWLVLFLKIWASRRKINEAYHGTLSSYGWSLMAAYFCMHILNPPILSNLQQIERPEEPHEDDLVDGYDTYFFSDMTRLSKHFKPSNPTSLGMLILDFLDFYTSGFDWDNGVMSLSGRNATTKADKGWNEDQDRDHNYICIEDPFKTDYNIGRVVREEGYNLIRDELDRARAILREAEAKQQNQQHQIGYCMAVLLQERMDGPILFNPSNGRMESQLQGHNSNITSGIQGRVRQRGNKDDNNMVRSTAAPILTMRRSHADEFPPLGR